MSRREAFYSLLLKFKGGMWGLQENNDGSLPYYDTFHQMETEQSSSSPQDCSIMSSVRTSTRTLSRPLNSNDNSVDKLFLGATLYNIGCINRLTFWISFYLNRMGRKVKKWGIKSKVVIYISSISFTLFWQLNCYEFAVVVAGRCHKKTSQNWTMISYKCRLNYIQHIGTKWNSYTLLAIHPKFQQNFKNCWWVFYILILVDRYLF